MTQRSAANPKLASKIQNDASWTDAERKFLMDYVQKSGGAAPSKVAANTEANKENIPNYNPQPVLRPLLPKQIRTYEKPQPAPKKQKTTQSQPQPAPVKTKPTQPQVPNTKDPKPVQATAGSKPQPSSLPPLLVPRNTTATTATAATVAASDVVVSGPVQASTQLVAADSKINKKQEEAVRQRIQEIKQRVKLLEEQREVNIDTQWNLFLEADALQKKKLELRAESHRIYSEIEREIFALRKEYAELMCLDRKLIEEHD